MVTKLKNTKEAVDAYKKELMAEQGNKCPLCGGSLLAVTGVNRVLDHDHDTGYCRAVVCRGCNGAEGKVLSVVSGYGKAGNNKHFQIRFLRNLLAYWEKHLTPQTSVIYHKHKSAAELREAANKKARLAYARKKKGG